MNPVSYTHLYNTINNHKRSLKASFYIAIQDDCVRKNPFDFKLSEVIENDTKEKVALDVYKRQGYLPAVFTMQLPVSAKKPARYRIQLEKLALFTLRPINRM